MAHINLQRDPQVDRSADSWLPNLQALHETANNRNACSTSGLIFRWTRDCDAWPVGTRHPPSRLRAVIHYLEYRRPLGGTH